MEKLADLVRQLREKVYFLTEHRLAQERVWEDEDDQRDRENNNKTRREAWDKETERMIQDCVRVDRSR